MVITKIKVLILTILFIVIYPIHGQVSGIAKGIGKGVSKKAIKKEFRKKIIKDQRNNYKKNISKNIRKGFKPPKGGLYKNLKIQRYRNPKTGKIQNLSERHHMPSCKSMKDALGKGNYSKKTNAVAIVMKKEDHKLTKSYGKSKAATEFRKKETKFLKEGKPNSAFRENAKDVLGLDKDKPKGYDGKQYLKAVNKAEADYRNWKKKYYYKQYKEKTGKDAAGQATDKVIENTGNKINDLFDPK